MTRSGAAIESLRPDASAWVLPQRPPHQHGNVVRPSFVEGIALQVLADLFLRRHREEALADWTLACRSPHASEPGWRRYVRRRGYRQGGEALGVALWQSADMSAQHSAVSGISNLCRFCGFAHMPSACHAPKSSVVSRVRTTIRPR